MSYCAVSGLVNVENQLTFYYDAPYLYDPYIDDSYIDSEELVNYDRRAPYKTDSKLETAIEQELWSSPYVDLDQVNVSVNGGVAALPPVVLTRNRLRQDWID